MVYSHGTWIVKPGQEDEFVKRWLEAADWTIENFPGARGTLVRDLDEPNRFISFGPWPSAEHVERWRGTAEFRRWVEHIQETLDSSEPRTLQLVAEVS